MVSLLAAGKWECGCREVGVWDLLEIDLYEIVKTK